MPAVWPIVALCVFFVIITIRSLRLRITIDDEVLRVTQWFRATSVPLANIRAVGVLPYDGFLNWGNIDGSGAHFPMVAVEIAASPSRVRGFVVTASRPRSATLKAARLHRAIVDRGYSPDLRAGMGANSSG